MCGGLHMVREIVAPVTMPLYPTDAKVTECVGKNVLKSKKSRVVTGRRVAASAIAEGNDGDFQNAQRDTIPSGPGSVRQPPIALPATFNRNAYMRDYMKDRTQAKKQGLTVKAYREMRGKETVK